MAADRGEHVAPQAVEDERAKVDFELRVPFVTLLKIALFGLLVVVTIKLWPVILMVITGALIAVVLDPVAGWMQRHGVRRGFATAIIAIVLFGIVGAFVFAVIPAMVGQVQALGGSLPRITAKISEVFPAAKPVIQTLTAESKKPLSAAQIQQWLTRGLIAGRYAAAGLTALVLVLVIALYLLIEGRRVIEWLTAFAAPQRRPRIRKTLMEVHPIVFAYMRGQAITCTLCGAMALTTGLVLHLPGALVLAVIAFVADLVPVVGTIAMTVPAVAIAATQSSLKAVIVLFVYLAYHLIESYLIIPRVYGSEMRLSTLAVLLAVLVGGTLQGALGAVLILPFAAAYPVIERIWLADRLTDTVRKHEAIESAE